MYLFPLLNQKLSVLASCCQSNRSESDMPGSQAANEPLTKGLLHPSLKEEKRNPRKKQLIQSVSSCFINVNCPGCYKITTVPSQSQWFSVRAVHLCAASLPEERPNSQKVVPLEESKSSDPSRFMNLCFVTENRITDSVILVNLLR